MQSQAQRRRSAGIRQNRGPLVRTTGTPCMSTLDALLSPFRAMAMFEDCHIVLPDSPGMDGDTPLHVVAMDGDVDCLQAMLPFVRDIDMVGDCGNTPLHYAVRWNHPDTAAMLIAHGADVMRPNDDGDVPLQEMRGQPGFQALCGMFDKDHDA